MGREIEIAPGYLCRGAPRWPAAGARGGGGTVPWHIAPSPAPVSRGGVRGARVLRRVREKRIRARASSPSPERVYLSHRHRAANLVTRFLEEWATYRKRFPDECTS